MGISTKITTVLTSAKDWPNWIQQVHRAAEGYNRYGSAFSNVSKLDFNKDFGSRNSL